MGRFLFALGLAACAHHAAAPPAAPPDTAKPADTVPGSPAAAPVPHLCTPTAAPSEDSEGDHVTVDDGFEPPAAAGASSAPLPFADLGDADLAARLKTDIGALGPMSIGAAHGGVLVAGVQMPAGDNWEVVSPGLAWGTKETIDAIVHAIDSVAARYPNTPKAFVGNISAPHGGHLPPHVSHQSGRDVDLGYYLTEGHRWYATANANNLDRPRTWQLVRSIIADSDVDLILMDTAVQRLLEAYAREIGEDATWLDQVFQVRGKSARPVIFHAKGHATHLHARFYSPIAQELGRRAYRMLLARHLISPPTLTITHTTKPGETLSHLALRYKVTPEAIKKANGMTSDLLRVNKPYRIPQVGGVPPPARVAVPERRIPPPLAGAARPAGEPCN